MYTPPSLLVSAPLSSSSLLLCYCPASAAEIWANSLSSVVMVVQQTSNRKDHQLAILGEDGKHLFLAGPHSGLPSQECVGMTWRQENVQHHLLRRCPRDKLLCTISRCGLQSHSRSQQGLVRSSTLQFLQIPGRRVRSSTELPIMSDFLQIKEVVGRAPCQHLGVVGCNLCTFRNHASSPPSPPQSLSSPDWRPGPPSPSNAAFNCSLCEVPCTDQTCPIHFVDLEDSPPGTPRPIRPDTPSRPDNPRPDSPTPSVTGPSGPQPAGPQPSRCQRDVDEDSTSVRTLPTRHRYCYWHESFEERKYQEERQNVQNCNLRESYQVGFNQGLQSLRQLHNNYVSPINLAPAFAFGFLSSAVGIIIGVGLYGRIQAWDHMTFF